MTEIALALDILDEDGNRIKKKQSRIFINYEIEKIFNIANEVAFLSNNDMDVDEAAARLASAMLVLGLGVGTVTPDDELVSKSEPAYLPAYSMAMAG